MKRYVLFGVVLIFWLSLTADLMQAQAQTISPEAKAELAKSVVPPPSNQVVGIDIDDYIGQPLTSPARPLHGFILVRSILTHGDPQKPSRPGAVLQYRKELALATIMPGNRTALVDDPEEIFLFVEAGKGRIDDGSQYWDLRENMGVLIPPRVRYRIGSTSDERLDMLMLTWTPDPSVNPGTSILVRDVDQMPYTDCGGAPCHWSYWGKNVFNPQHGLHPNEAFHVVYMAPMSIAEPHAHVTGWEEIWTKLPSYSSYLMLGSEVREMPPNTAFLAPPNYKTVHSVVNLRREGYQKWLFIGRFIFPQPNYGRDPLVAPQPLESH
jgi:mannose-6-phosphate isomerase-like protein (cupin superfamily)